MFDSILQDNALKLLNALDKHGKELIGEELAGIVKLHSIIYALLMLLHLIPDIIHPDLVGWCFTIVLWGMYYRINSKIEIPFSKNIILSIVTGACINLVMGGLGYVIFTILDRLELSVFFAVLSRMFVVYVAMWCSGLAYFMFLTFLAERNIFIKKDSEEPAP